MEYNIKENCDKISMIQSNFLNVYMIKSGKNITINKEDIINIIPYYDKEQKCIMLPIMIDNKFGHGVFKIGIPREEIMKCIADGD